MRPISFSGIRIGGGAPLVLIAGPCVIENRDMILRSAERIKLLARRYKMPVVFKSSYKKANRTSGRSFASIGEDKALRILADVKDMFGMPVLTDVHSRDEVHLAADVADVLQIPAFLCRQTELLQAAGRSGKVVNIKKGQFVAPDDMEEAVKKVAATGNKKVLLTERGTSFGYHNLVVDMRSLEIMRRTGCPIVLDATHSVQLPGGEKGRSGGEPEFIFPIARAGVAVGCDAIFVETHPNPKKALSDPASQLPLSRLGDLLKQVKAVDSARRKATGA